MPTDAADLFVATFGQTPTGVWSAPGRVNLIGEYTDVAEGPVLPFAIDRRASVAARRRADELVRLVARGQRPVEIDLSAISRGRPSGWGAYLAGVVWASRQHGANIAGCDLALVSDVPVGAGLSSSAAIASAALVALNDLFDLHLDRLTLSRLGRKSENVIVGVPCGAMDHSASLRCRQGHALYLDTRTGSAEQVPLDLSGHDLALLVIDTRAPHRLIDGGYAQRRTWIEEARQGVGGDLAAALVDDLEASTVSADAVRAGRHVITECARVGEVHDLLLGDRLGDIGPALLASHASLRDDLRVSCPELDLAVESAVSAGALGARLTGGGFGGSAIALVSASDSATVASEVEHSFAARGLTRPSVHEVVPSDGAHRDT